LCLCFPYFLSHLSKFLIIIDRGERFETLFVGYSEDLRSITSAHGFSTEVQQKVSSPISPSSPLLLTLPFSPLCFLSLSKLFIRPLQQKN
jgi:hypothetical protein